MALGSRSSPEPRLSCRRQAVQQLHHARHWSALCRGRAEGGEEPTAGVLLMSTAEEFAQHLQTVVAGTVYTSKLPAKPDSADDQWSVVADGGEPATGGNFLLW